MNPFSVYLKELLGKIFNAEFGTPEFYLAAIISALVALAAGRWILKVFFSESRSYITVSLAGLAAFFLVVAAFAANKAWIWPHIEGDVIRTTSTVITGAAGVLLAVAVTRVLLAIKIPVAIAFLLLVAGIGFAVDLGVIYAYKAIAGAVTKFEQEQQPEHGLI